MHQGDEFSNDLERDRFLDGKGYLEFIFHGDDELDEIKRIPFFDALEPHLFENDNGVIFKDITEDALQVFFDLFPIQL